MLFKILLTLGKICNFWGMQMTEKLTAQIRHSIALTMIPGLGHRRAKLLIDKAGDATTILTSSYEKLRKCFGVSENLARAIASFRNFEPADHEISTCEAGGIEIIPYGSDNYPERLLHIPNSPVVLYRKGPGCDPSAKTVAIVGTRKATEYGRLFTRQLVEGLKDVNPVIISGLASGIDCIAHQAALDYGLRTTGVIGHGFKYVYPAAHRNLFRKIIERGNIYTDFRFDTLPERGNFPSRNRIVAGLADAVVVIEAGETGGALITAELAAGFHKDVFALPGRVTDKYSAGCLQLIQSQTAMICTSAEDIIREMGWKSTVNRPAIQRKIFTDMEPDEECVAHLLQENQHLEIDTIGHSLGWTPGKTSTVLFQMEMKGLLHVLPGKRYVLL